MSKVSDLIGERFGRLTVVERAQSNSRGKAMWMCQCECGQQTTVPGYQLSRGHTKSCGCMRAETTKKLRTTHGKRKTRLYKEWENMKRRCYGEACKDYPNYGGRGITVCAEWLESFEAFMDWALTNGYRDDLTLDREDTDGPYSPENCRWATQKEQANNKRNNRLITCEGKTQTLQQWADETGISRKTIEGRLSRGWDVRLALTKPARKMK